MTYGELFQQARKELGSDFEARQLFTHATNKHIAHLPALARRPVPERAETLLLSLCQRRAQGEPLQYLLGEWEFYGLPFRVGKGVLIPRQDTESLVDEGLARIAGLHRPQVLDLCSGSGCVAIALNHERPDARVTALELSDAAFPFLRENIMLNDSPVKAVHMDLRDYTHPLPLDLLVSNPPYIPRDAIAGLQREVGFEPRRALDGGADGLDFYRWIIRRYQSQLKPGGWLCLEVGIGQSEQVSAILAAEGLPQVETRDDYTGVPRVVSGRRASESQEGTAPQERIGL